jgi:SAM-dependent methyltransferase
MRTCNSCDAQLEDLLDLGDHPIANQLTEMPSAIVKVYPMKVGGCPRCGLVQLTEPIDPQLFYTNYATPTSWKREPHIDKLVTTLRSLIDRESRILDVGCNDGRFLQHLLADGWQNIAGLEPTRNTSEEAMRQGFTVYQQSLDFDVARQLIQETGLWDCVSLRQVLEHVGNLQSFGQSLNLLLNMNGILVIEVPDSRTNIVGHDYALWEEHVNYFTPETLGSFLRAHGFEPIDSYVSLFSGVCLTVIARKVAESNLDSTEKASISTEELRIQTDNFHSWADEYEGFKLRVQDEIEMRFATGQVVLYGVGSRSSNFINIMDIASLVSFAIDDQPQKQNRFMPSSGIPILSTAEASSRMRESEVFALLGVNGENEDALLETSELLRDRKHASILPPSRRLLKAWGAQFRSGEPSG